LALPFLLVASVAGAADAPAPKASASALEATSPAKTASGAQAVIGRFNDVLLSMMKQAEKLGYHGRFDFVAPIVRKTFDCSFMARKTVGRYWDDLSDEDQSRWVKTFEDFTISNLADRFHGYSGQAFEVLGERPASRNTLIVLTLLHRTGGADDVELNYRMRETPAGWRVIDVYANGKVSEVALRRAEYARSLKQGGIELLIDSVAKMTASRAAPAS
jgi:phospholipid transport system substrate-binding protein